MPTCAQQLLKLSASLGVNYIFTNLGSDHPAFIEAFARLRENGEAMPEVIICPHEMTALSAAHGYAMITRKPQLVLVHVDVGTQNLGGSVHDAARGRVPAIIVAGLSPVTDAGGRAGTRNEFIHDLQDAPRQREIVGQYMKWTYELRAAENVEGVFLRALQMATTEPQGPVYLTGAREVWETSVTALREPPADWPAAVCGGLAEHAVRELAGALIEAKRPIVITSYLGRQPGAVERLVRLSERVGIGVCEASPSYVNFPGNHPHHLSYRRNSLIEEADLILMLDVDVPWIKAKARPAPGAKLFHIDIDPIKAGIGFWHYPAQHVCLADTAQALDQLLAAVNDQPAGREARCEWIGSAKQRLSPAPATPAQGPITSEELTYAVRELVHDRTTIVFEAPTATETIPSILKLTRPGSFFSSGGTGLGWGINAAIGAKLAGPEAEVIALVGDGCYAFGVPSSSYWVASAYKVPFLTVIYNNGGWQAPKFSTLQIHPEGSAKRNDTFWVTMTAGARLADIAAASGDVKAFRVADRENLRDVLRRALDAVRSGQAAVVDVAITPVSGQVLGKR